MDERFSIQETTVIAEEGREFIEYDIVENSTGYIWARTWDRKPAEVIRDGLNEKLG